MSNDVKVTMRFLSDNGVDSTLGVYHTIVENFEAGKTDELHRLATAYNAQHGTTASDEEFCTAFKVMIADEDAHMLAFMRAMAHEEIDPMGFHEQAFFDSLEPFTPPSSGDVKRADRKNIPGMFTGDVKHDDDDDEYFDFDDDED